MTADALGPAAARAARALATARLLQLASPALPVGAYSYSQGLERAVEDGIVVDETGAGAWIEGALRLTAGGFEAPMLARMLAAWSAGDAPRALDLDAVFVASRETAELRAETLQMGHSLLRLMQVLPATAAACPPLATVPEVSYPCAWACAAAALGCDPTEAITAYLYAWLENQVLAAVKLVPLGQSAGQRLLSGLSPLVAALVAEMPDDEALSNFAPGLALASARHETQYSRLFRS